MGVLSDAFKNFKKRFDLRPSSNVNFSSNSNKIRSEYISNTKNNLFIVNGRKLKPGTDEYIKAEMAFEKDMMKFERDMEQFGRSMNGFGKNMDDISKEIRDIFKVKE